MSTTDPAWLVVGLGNPGTRYASTRHNAGARAVEHLAARLGARLRTTRGVAQAGEARHEGVRLVLARPRTYMNESGRAVAALLRLKKLAPDRLVVVHDEIDLPDGALKVKQGGGSAGNRGVESVVQALGNRDFYRVRIGVGRPRNPQQDPADFVLEPLSRKAAAGLAETEARAADAVLLLVHEGLEATMNRYHGRAADA